MYLCLFLSMYIFLGLLSCSTDLYFCFCAGTILYNADFNYIRRKSHRWMKYVISFKRTKLQVHVLGDVSNIKFVPIEGKLATA